jgi:CRISPR-associated protein Csd1
MILQSLVQYYDRLASDPNDPMTPAGFSREKISFALVIAPDGSSAELVDERQQQDKKFFPTIMAVPDRGGRSGTALKPNFLWDNSGYVLGRDSKGKVDRSRQAFEAFRDFHTKMAEIIQDEELAAVAKFLAGWLPQRADDFRLFEEAIDKNIVFRIGGRSHYVHQSPLIAREWRPPPEEDEAVVSGQSLVSGDTGPLARLHPLISGVKGAQTMGAAIASFNLDAFTSYGLVQTYNAPVSVVDAFKYTTALNRLLENRHRRIQLADATFVFWASEPTLLEEVCDAFFGDAPLPKPAAPAEDVERVREVRQFLSQLREGYAAGEAISPDSDVKFYILGLSPNASRISVRFWQESSVAEMKQRLARHLQDIELVGAHPNDPPLVMKRIVQATGRAEFTGGTFKGYDADAIPPLIAGAVARAIFQGIPYPRMLLGQMLNRIRADGHVSHVRVAAVKACLVRNLKLNLQDKEVLVALDTTRTDPGYVAGRVFALLEKIQQDSARGELNATIKDRYFSAASATPGMVFPRLIRLNQHHMAKLETPQRIYYDKLLGEAMDKLNNFSSQFDLEEQGLFAIGYFHQRQDFYVSKKQNKEGDIQ